MIAVVKKFELFSATAFAFSFAVGILDELILCDHVIHIDDFIGNRLVEIGDSSVAHLLDGAHQIALFQFYLAVFAPALQKFLAEFGRTVGALVERLFDLVAGLGCHHKTEPVLLGDLSGSSGYLHGVAGMELVVQLAVAPVDFASYAGAAKFGMDVESKVKHCRTEMKMSTFIMK